MDNVFCEKHNANGAVYTKGRPLLDDTCYICKCERLESELEAIHNAYDINMLEVRTTESSMANREPHQLAWHPVEESLHEVIKEFLAANPDQLKILLNGQPIVINRMLGYLTEYVRLKKK